MRPDRIGRYQVLRELGRGAMGVVYLAHDPAIDRDVAIKMVAIGEGLPPAEQEEARRRFQREARAAGQLIHPGIVLVFDVGLHDRRNLFIAMEHVQGTTLDAFTRLPDLLPVDRVVDLTVQACEALDFAHRSRIVHRDIKPANLMVVDGTRLKIMDFGLAKDPGSELTHTGTLVGTPSYMSPEQIRGEDLDGRTDLFSLGVVLHELLTGTRPFPGDSISNVIYRILNEEPASPAGAGGREVPAALQAGLARALQKAPGARFQTGAEMARALREAVGAPEARPATADVTRISPAKPRPAPAAGARGRSRRPAARRRAGPALVLLAVAAAAAGAVLLHPPTRRFWVETVPGAARVLQAFQARWGGPGSQAGPRLWLTADRGGARFRIDGQTVEADFLPWEPDLAGRVVEATDGCLSGRRTIPPGLAPGSAIEVGLDAAVLRPITVRSYPPGAAVKVDGRETGGVTPLDMEVAACQGHEIVLSLPYHRNARLSLPDGTDWAGLTAEPVPLFPLPEGRLTVRSPYPVEIREEGLRVGESGETLTMAAGLHRLEFVAPRYQVNAVQEVLIDPGAEALVQAPVPGLARVRVNALPGNAVILVDGVALGPPPLTLTLGAGEHRFECRWNVGSGGSARRTVHLLEGSANPPVNFRPPGRDGDGTPAEPEKAGPAPPPAGR